MKPSKKIRPLDLPRGRQAVATGTRCSLAGWGQTHQPGNLARALQELDLRVLDTSMCNNSRFWHGDISPHMICLAADSKSQAPCKVRVLGVGVLRPACAWLPPFPRCPEAGKEQVPTSQVQKLRHRETKQLAHGHTVGGRARL